MLIQKHSASKAYALTHVEEFDHLDDCGGDTGTGAEDGGSTCLVEGVVILRRNNTADYHHDVLTAELLELVDDLGHEGLVTGCEGGCRAS